MFYPPYKHKTQNLTANRNLSDNNTLIIKITTHSIWRFGDWPELLFRITKKGIKHIKCFFLLCWTCLHNVTSSKNWRDVICFGVALSCNTVSLLYLCCVYHWKNAFSMSLLFFLILYSIWHRFWHRMSLDNIVYHGYCLSIVLEKSHIFQQLRHFIYSLAIYSLAV